MLGAEQALPIFRVFVFLKEKKNVFSAHTPAQLSTVINDGPFFKFPFCSAWGLASVDMLSTRINDFGKPTRLSMWQQMVQLKAFVVLMLELAATWSSYHFINNDAATAVWINCPLYFAGPTTGVDSFMMVRRVPSHSATVAAREENVVGWREWGWRPYLEFTHVLFDRLSVYREEEGCFRFVEGSKVTLKDNLSPWNLYFDIDSLYLPIVETLIMNR